MTRAGSVLGVRALALLLAVVVGGCGPFRVVPAVGSKLATRACFVTETGVYVFREPAARCPTYAGVTERVRRVEERYGEPVGGVVVTIVAAYVQCGEGSEIGGCTYGDNVTVQDDATVLRTIEHELSHVAITRRWGDGSLAEFDLDHPADRRSRCRLW